MPTESVDMPSESEYEGLKAIELAVDMPSESDELSRFKVDG